MTPTDQRNDAIQQLREKIKGVRIAMLTTVETNDELRSRPMATQEIEFDGDLWFFTQADAPKVGEVERDQQVNVSYAKPDDQRYVSVSGTAQIVRDRQKIDQLWQPLLKAWFPNGKDDPNIALLKVNVTGAEYWDSPSSAVVQITGFVKSAVTGQQPDMGENAKLDLH